MTAGETGSRAEGDKVWAGRGGQQKGEQALPVASPWGFWILGVPWGKPPLYSPRKMSRTRSPQSPGSTALSRWPSSSLSPSDPPFTA